VGKKGPGAHENPIVKNPGTTAGADKVRDGALIIPIALQGEGKDMTITADHIIAAPADHQKIKADSREIAVELPEMETELKGMETGPLEVKAGVREMETGPNRETITAIFVKNQNSVAATQKPLTKNS
jgi:hypothetical protein